ncbi:helix-turn-helix domain-containing protein [Clostridium perfringens]|nr:helix-turn-helix domain-containing protein [Clostridium perfringens]MDK0631129.1 helix-turn-helix domain-containing protein [Clostridium perfringens]
MSISENIKFYRKKRGLTQQELADKIEKSINSVKKYESGYTNPPIDVINKIADVLEINVIHLIEDNIGNEIIDRLKNDSSSDSVISLLEERFSKIGNYDKKFITEVYETFLDIFKELQKPVLSQHNFIKKIDNLQSIKIKVDENFINTFAKATFKYYLEKDLLTFEKDPKNPNAIIVNFEDIDDNTLSDSN